MACSSEFPPLKWWTLEAWLPILSVSALHAEYSYASWGMIKCLPCRDHQLYALGTDVQGRWDLMPDARQGQVALLR